MPNTKRARVSNWSDYFGAQASKHGARIGGAISYRVGAWVGSWADALTRWVTGHGDYTIHCNSCLRPHTSSPLRFR